MSGMMLHGLGDCTPERNCGCLQPRIDHRKKAEEILQQHVSPNDPHGRAIAHALIALHDLLDERLPMPSPRKRARHGQA